MNAFFRYLNHMNVKNDDIFLIIIMFVLLFKKILVRRLTSMIIFAIMSSNHLNIAENIIHLALSYEKYWYNRLLKSNQKKKLGYVVKLR